MKILIADDEIRLRKVVALYMRRCGHEVIEAENGQQAIEMTKSQSPDVIVFDVVMPIMTGLEATRSLKDDPETKHIPIILLTANASEKDYKLGKEAGADKYITKPFSPKELMESISEMVNK